jgi:hypothetical protein
MTLRELFINWLTASRFIKSLEARIVEQRMDYTELLADKQNQIKLLRIELAGTKLECDRMRAVLMPFGSPAGAAFAQQYQTGNKPPVVPAFEGPDDWQAELNKIYEKEQSDGVSEQRREEVLKQTAHDAAQPFHGAKIIQWPRPDGPQ